LRSGGRRLHAGVRINHYLLRDLSRLRHAQRAQTMHA